MALATADTTFTLDDAALSDWANGLTQRIGLQSELVWVGLNDGYQDAGGRDVAIPYLGLYWLLGHTIKGQHCQTCLLLSFGNPYDPPGTPGGKVIYQSPGDGQTECGAGCKCWLEYGLPNASLPRNYAWNGVKLPGPGAATREIGQQQLERAARAYSWQETMLLDPESEQFTAEQKGALDLFRAKWFAWEDVRGSLPQLPQMFEDMDRIADIPELDQYWDAMTPQQRDILIDMQEAIVAWNDATAQASGGTSATGETGLAEWDDESIQLFGFGGFRGFFGGRGAGRAGGHSAEFEADHPRGIGGKFRLKGFHKGEGEHTGRRGGGKGEEERAGHGGGRRTGSAREKSPNEEAARHMTRNRSSAERTAGRASGENRAREAQDALIRAGHATDEARQRYGLGSKEAVAAHKAWMQAADHADHFDLRGQEMPFSGAQVAKAFNRAWAVVGGGHQNDVGVAKIAGKKYYIKQLSFEGNGRANVTTQGAREVGLVAMAKAFNMPENATTAAYHVLHDGQHYAVTAKVEGKPVAALRFGAKEAFRAANQGLRGQKNLMYEYMTGMGDRHSGNVIFNQKTRHTIEIDGGFEFEQHLSLAWHNFGVRNASPVLKAFVRGNEAHLERVALDRAALRAFVGRQSAVERALRQSGMNNHDLAGVRARFNILRRLSARSNPTMKDWNDLANAAEAERIAQGGEEV